MPIVSDVSQLMMSRRCSSFAFAALPLASNRQVTAEHGPCTSCLSTPMASSFPDYYELLGVQPSATQDEIRQAYKRESLKSHPDRLAGAPPDEVKRATERFQVSSIHLPAFVYVLTFYRLSPTRTTSYQTRHDVGNMIPCAHHADSMSAPRIQVPPQASSPTSRTCSLVLVREVLGSKVADKAVELSVQMQKAFSATCSKRYASRSSLLVVLLS